MSWRYLPKPSLPLLSLSTNLSRVIYDSMYIGFSSSSGSIKTSHYVLGWSFKINGQAPGLNLTSLPSLPLPQVRKNKTSNFKPYIVVTATGITYIVVMKMRYAEVLEDWEVEYQHHRFSYKDLYKATKGFREDELLGIGGFGRVYRGKLRNLVQHLGYCRRKGELLLVYEFMPNGSLNKFIFGAFLLEVVCGRRPLLQEVSPDFQNLVDWVWNNWKRGEILESMDVKLGNDFRPEQVELVLRLGLLCLHPSPNARPSISRVVQILNEITADRANIHVFTTKQHENFSSPIIS